MFVAQKRALASHLGRKITHYCVRSGSGLSDASFQLKVLQMRLMHTAADVYSRQDLRKSRHEESGDEFLLESLMQE